MFLTGSPAPLQASVPVGNIHPLVSFEPRGLFLFLFGFRLNKALYIAFTTLIVVDGLQPALLLFGTLRAVFLQATGNYILLSTLFAQISASDLASRSVAFIFPVSLSFHLYPAVRAIFACRIPHISSATASTYTLTQYVKSMQNEEINKHIISDLRGLL